MDDATGATVTGTGEPNTTVTVYGPDGTTILGTGTVQPDGTYSVTIPTQVNGEDLTVTLTDAAGNESLPTPAEAPDLTAPGVPTADVDDATGTIVTGTGEPGATVTVYGPDGTTILGTDTVQPGGTYSVTIPAQVNGEDLTVTQTDAAGNESLPTPAEAPDLTAPGAPTADVDDATGTIVTGTGEPGATVTVYGPDGTTVLGTDTVQPGGTYSVTIPAQTNGEDLIVTLTDAAGNESLPTPVEAPDQFDAFDNADSAGLDLVPATTDVDVGSANYLLLVSLATVDPQLDLAGLQLLGIEPVSFTVAPGHELDATFEYGGLLDIGVIADYQVVLQKFVDGQWVGVDGDGESTLLELGLLNGNLSGSANLDAGEYRAFVTFGGVLGAGVLGTLDVSGVDSDYTSITDIVAQTAEGNVILDANGTGEVDLAPAGTVVHSVTVNDVTTDVTADGTIVDGEYGTLVIDLDGSYVYTPDEDAANIGEVETFTYTLQNDGGAQESATLTIDIGSPDVTSGFAATDDAATAAVLYENTVDVVDTPLFTLNNGIGVIIPSTDTDSGDFTVAADTVSDLQVVIDTSEGLTVLPSYTVTLRDGDGNVLGSPVTVVALANVLGIGTGAVVTFDDLPAGDYNVEVTSTNTLGLGYDSAVSLTQEITNLTEFQVDVVSGVDGNLLDNDVTGSLFTAVLVDSGGGFAEIGDTPATLTGTYGTLTVDEGGGYHYEPDPNLAYFDTDQTDVFTYQIRHPDGEVVQAELTVTIGVNDPGGTLPFMASALTSGAGDTIALDGFDTAIASDRGTPAGSENFAYDLFEGQGDLVEVLEGYLSGNPNETTESEAVSMLSGKEETSEMDQNSLPIEDPLGFLSFHEPDELNGNNHPLI
ncbi:BapA/Bap/LapF family large adhesin [Sphingopyxis panaciterrulae]|uniref:VCBS repeat-containing protein n=1 Tax=Sphingopyxis panaciterrulae TaxID=462372 RepID=A0A7W9ERK0_9SPHN|nr:VCBS repeat-containing protein [Sphingopyxis panaciterrulae]